MSTAEVGPEKAGPEKAGPIRSSLYSRLSSFAHEPKLKIVGSADGFVAYVQWAGGEDETAIATRPICTAKCPHGWTGRRSCAGCNGEVVRLPLDLMAEIIPAADAALHPAEDAGPRFVFPPAAESAA